jgi:amino acid transporter
MSKVFLREATGLIRELSALDAVWVNLGLVGIWFSLTFISSTAPLTGGDPLIGGLMTLILMAFIALSFSIVSVLTPRTAGDYVFTSRYLHPALGFVGNAGYFVATVPLFMGITITTIESFGFSALFAYWGLAMGNQTFLHWASLLSTGTYEFALGGSLTVVFALLTLFGNRLFRAIANVILPLVLISVALMFVVLAVTPQSAALSRLQTLAGNQTLVNAVNAWGAANNNPIPSYHNFANTLALNAVYVVGFSYIISAVYVAGEVRQVKKNMPVAIMATLLITFIIFAGSTLLSYKAFGYNFLSNLYSLSIFYSKSPFPVVPYLDFLAAAISNNVVLGSFIIIMAIIQLLWYQSNAVFIGGRLLLSYSFDRIMPSYLGDVSTKYHGPAKAILTCLVIGLLAGLVFVLPSTAAVAFLMSSAAVAIILLFPITVVGVALLAYRFRKPQEFRANLGQTWLGGPVFYISALITIVYSLFVFYEYITVPAIFGFAGNEGLALIFVPIIVLFAIFYVAKTINQRRGIEFNSIFTQIPPE